MIEFTLFGIPIRVHPWHWIGLAIIGGALNIQEASDLIFVLLFIIAGFLAILIHEMGHALVGKKLGGGTTAVDLVFLGGYTQHFGTHFKGKQRAMMILAGPASTFLFGIFGWLLCLAFFQGNFELTNVASIVLAKSPWNSLGIIQTLGLENSDATKLYFIGCMIFVSFWWTIFNLLPIFPMDGGQFIAQYIRSARKVHLIGMITAIIVGLSAFMIMNSYLLFIFMIFFAFDNYRNYKSSNF